ncbi:unnamed protein product [Hermetia illucens]|uniref:Hemolectin n=1 Tax=Hermetia illucens TaxID=343691 RepID=A0A7R8UJC9_HERIL|nr:unnamed protein product [Hermetia illucens]
MLVVISFTILVGLPNAISDFGLNQQAYTGIKTKAQGFFAKTHIGWPFGNRKQQPFENLSECNERLHDVSNAHVKCTNNFCKVMCFEGYKFPSGETVLHMACKNNVWVIQNSDLSDITDCEPICGPPCENNGICIAPGECRCPENYFGPRCEIRKKLCLTRPPVPKNSRIVCNAASCSVTCARGFFFPDGSTITNLKCVEGQWIPTRQDFNKVPDCQPTCEPPCENGGNCLGHNVCECINDFKGPQCQYSVDRCSPKKMLFNGGYNCHGDNFVLTCQLYCPSNIDFEFPPATLYTCKFSKGYFEPRNIPQCVYGENVQIIGVGGKYDKKQEHKYKIDSQPQDISSWEATIKKIINKRKNIPGVKTHFDYSTSSGIPNVHILYNSPKEKRVPSPGICFTWGGNHVKTFDGLLFKFPIYCSHVLVRDHVDEEFSIVYKTCPSAETDCAVSLEIYFQDTLYTLTTKNDVIVLSTPKKRLPIPVQLIGIKVIHVGQQLKIDLEAVGLVILWDGKHYISIEANAGLWNRTSGLCGTLDMSSHNDFMSRDGSTASTIKTFIDSWKIVDDRDKCTMESLEEFRKEKECTSDEEIEAAKFCTKLLGTEQLQECLAEFDKALLAEYCMEEYCNCHSEDNPSNCNCNAFSVFVKECQFKGNQLRNGWRSSEVCPMKCDKERVYMPCGPATDTSCGSAVENAVVESCNEGCFCPEGTLQHQGKCIPIDQCPCRLRNKVFEAGSEVKKDCNTCLCKNGIWTCTDISCGARCSAVGDPHYITFDGRRFDFMGKCSYYLMKTLNISIESENIVCPGSISESMNFEPTSAIGMPSCTKSVTIRFEINGKEIAVTLDQGNAIYVNNKQVTEYPKVVGNGILTIRKASTIIISVDFADGLRVWWDGMTRVYIDAPSSYRGKTQGLCGTFNSNMQDDFLTPEGDIENSVEPFADKWKTKDTCDFTSEANPPVHPCQDNLEKKEKAEKYCTKLIGEIFEGCHWSVDPTPYFEDCMFDVCACRGDASLCLCPIFASYGAECNRQGVITNWRYHVKECAIECPLGQIFDECGDSCLRTCEDLASKDVCRGHCVEGCRCPPGQYLNSKNECIPEEQCQCMYDGLNFNNGYKEVRPGRQFLELW